MKVRMQRTGLDGGRRKTVEKQKLGLFFNQNDLLTNVNVKLVIDLVKKKKENNCYL